MNGIIKNRLQLKKDQQIASVSMKLLQHSKRRSHKAPVLSRLVAKIIQATGYIGTQWILDLCNCIVKECCISQDWKSSVVLPIYKGKGDPMECVSYRGIKLLEHAMKVVERTFEYKIRQQIRIDDMQLGFMKVKGTTDAITKWLL